MIRWLASKFDSLLGSATAAVVALSASQFLAFVQQYRQRLGGHLDEARRNLSEVESGALYQSLDAASRQTVLADVNVRVDALQVADAALRDAGLFARPYAFARHFDRDIAAATLTDFQPALPLDIASLSYAGIGLLLGWLIYELVRSPVVAMARRSDPPKSNVSDS